MSPLTLTRRDGTLRTFGPKERGSISTGSSVVSMEGSSNGGELTINSLNWRSKMEVEGVQIQINNGDERHLKIPPGKKIKVDDVTITST